ncbi:MAG: hypothetical protein WD208_09870 [Dehalococcoidia bacterium]
MNRRSQGSARTRDKRGFMLLEFAISIGFIGALSALIMTSSFQTMKASSDGGAKLDLALESTKAVRWLIRDVHRADLTDLVDGGGAVATASFDWLEEGVSHSCTYSLDDNMLLRTCDGTASHAARNISGLEFTRDGRLVTVSFTITASRRSDVTEQVTLNFALGGG